MKGAQAKLKNKVKMRGGGDGEPDPPSCSGDSHSGSLQKRRSGGERSGSVEFEGATYPFPFEGAFAGGQDRHSAFMAL